MLAPCSRLAAPPASDWARVLSRVLFPFGVPLGFGGGGGGVFWGSLLDCYSTVAAFLKAC